MWSRCLKLLLGLGLAGCTTPQRLAPLPVAITANARLKAPITVHLSHTVTQNEALTPIVTIGPGEFDNTLAMNVRYEPILALRRELNQALEKELAFFTLWKPEGEAHVTVVTPVEYFRQLMGPNPAKPIISMQEIGEIAKSQRIQAADLEIQGLGVGRATLDGKPEETHFVIVESQRLRQVRRAIHAAFVRHGGKPGQWDPEHYYPHITVGYTRRDLHESDGVLKDRQHSLDPRFRLAP